ncbi:MAG: M20 family metallo-hydrolase, partial [candidate division WOR-3 bacterium]
DIVPPGPRELWLTDPHQAVVKDGRIYGRGAEDNQQGIVASFFALQALIDLGFQPGSDVGLVLVADDETGSRYGIDYVLKNEPRFRPNDIILVPDAGNQTGSEIEVAEKSIVWLKFTVIGKQAHGSRPDKGRNALRAGAKILLHIDRILHERYPALDPLFDPPGTTVEPTKKEANVPNINTIPAEDIFYFDCRVLPNYQITELLDLVQAEAGAIAQQCQVDVRVTTEQFEQAAPPTPSDAPVVKLLTQAVREVYGIETRTIGIGGGTVAAFFRRAGFPAAVWGRFAGTAHQPNEYCEIANLIGDAKVYAHIVGQ